MNNYNQITRDERAIISDLWIIGNTIRAKHIGKDIIAGLRTIAGGGIKEYTEVMNEARELALEKMMSEEKSLKADDVVNLTFTTSQVLSEAAELLFFRNIC